MGEESGVTYGVEFRSFFGNAKLLDLKIKGWKKAG